LSVSLEPTSNARVRQEKFYSEDQFFIVENLDFGFTGMKDFLKTDIQGSKGARRWATYAEIIPDHWLDSIFEG